MVNGVNPSSASANIIQFITERAQIQEQTSVAVAARAQQVQEQQGEAAVSLINAAAGIGQRVDAKA